MSAKPPTSPASQEIPFNFRTARGKFEWEGDIPDGDPGSLPVNRPRLTINRRIKNGAYYARPGQSKLNAAALHDAAACISGLFDFQVGTKKSLIVIGDGCAGISSSVGFFIGLYDFEQSPTFQPQIYYSAATANLSAGVYGDDLYLGVDNVLRRYQAIDAGYGDSALAISGSSQDIPIFTLPAGFTQISALQQFDGRLFVAAVQGAGTSKVILWDGLTDYDDVTGINAPTGFGLYRESLIMGYNGTPNRIDIRAAGAAPGTWTNVAPGAGTAAFKFGVSYKDAFYFTTGGEDLFSYNGTTLTRLAVGTTGITAGAVTYGIEVFNGFLYFTWTTGTSARLGRFDGTTWTATHKNFTTQVATISAARALRLYRGNLVAGVIKGGEGSLYESPGTTTSGTWVQRTVDNAANGDIDSLLVY